jgi:hypothetical protein
MGATYLGGRVALELRIVGGVRNVGQVLWDRPGMDIASRARRGGGSGAGLRRP